MYESQPLKCKHSKFVVYLVNIVRSLDKIVSSLSYGGHRVILMPWMVGSRLAALCSYTSALITSSGANIV